MDTMGRRGWEAGGGGEDRRYAKVIRQSVQSIDHHFYKPERKQLAVLGVHQ